MNKLENGVAATATVADAAIPKPGSPATNAGLVYNGSSWVAAKLIDANVDAAAAIAYTKLQLAGSIVNNDISASAAIALSKIVPTPGYEYSYVEYTSAVAISATTEATANTVVTAAATAFDGATAAIIEFFSPAISASSPGIAIILCLYDGSSSLGLFSHFDEVGTNSRTPVLLRRRLTPAAATKTYSVRAYVTSGSGFVIGGTGGTNLGLFLPGFIRITKV